MRERRLSTGPLAGLPPFFDASRWPVVEHETSRQPPGSVAAYCDALTLLTEQQQPFVLISHGPHDRVSDEDTQAKVSWWRSRGEAFDHFCRATIYIDADPTRRAWLENACRAGQLRLRSSRLLVAENIEAARRQASELLA